MPKIDLVDELVNSKIVHIGLLTDEQVVKLREVLELDEEDTFDMIMLMDDIDKK